MTRADGRAWDAVRKIELIAGFTSAPAGSVLVRWGDTHLLCTASIEERLPPWLRGSNQGWVTAEYAMLPGSTAPRNRREGVQGKVSGRTQEIQRLIARSLRQAVDLKQLGQRQITVDCEVLQADGGTRTAAVTAGYVALRLALEKLVAGGEIPESALGPPIAAVSVGIVDGEVLCDLAYVEDSRATVDANFVFSRGEGMVEVQATGEKAPFQPQELVRMVECAQAATQRLFALQDEALGKA